MLSTIEWIGPDRVMFSTDYPHWDQDDPRYAFKVALPEEWKRRRSTARMRGRSTGWIEHEPRMSSRRWTRSRPEAASS